ncbi:MAG: DUF3782 domain-containing protein [Deltaproteobacteria bacterium]|nr:DUF3782 domain-containing protein [Deltaproteobacteria bacterium]MBW2355108.1 DUF3782 domain-containing protein [Deltaproteobacteria bacterium]
MQTQTTEELKKLIMAELPNLIKSEPELRDFVLKITRDVYADRRETESRFDRMMDQLNRDREAGEKRWQAWEKKWEAQQKADREKWEAQEKKWEAQEKKWEAWEKKYEENQKVIHEMLDEIKRVDHRIDSTIGALGARWGMQAEEAFRDGLKAIVEKSFGVKVERYEGYDHEGVIFGRPDQVELDLIIKDGTLIICEIKSSMSRAEMYVFWRKKEFYEEKHNSKASRVMVISPMIDPKAKAVAEKLGIETYGYAGDAKI